MSHIKVKKWNFTAGPRQLSSAKKVISAFEWRAIEEIHLEGVIGIDERTSTRTSFSAMSRKGQLPEQPAGLWNDIWEQFGGEITRENCKEIEAAYREAMGKIEQTTIDERITPEQHKAELAQVRSKNERNAAEKAAKVTELVKEMRDNYPWAWTEECGKSRHARAARNVKKELGQAFPGFKFSVRSSSYSGGDSVDIDWTDGPTEAQVKEVSGKYQQGSFDGMQDLYEYDSSPESEAVAIVLGQSKYVSEHRNTSEGVKQAVAAQISKQWDPDNNGYVEIHGHHGKPSEMVHYVTVHAPIWGEFTGEIKVSDGANWVAVFDGKPPEAGSTQESIADQTTSYKVEKCYHTKWQTDFWIAIPTNRLEKDHYKSELARASDSGGWQSRKWGKCPSGFGFKTEQAAVEFTALTTSDKSDQPAAKPGIADRFREMANRMQAEIDGKLADRLENTHRRQAQANSARIEGRRLERTQQALRILADIHDSGEVPPELHCFTTKKNVYHVLGTILEYGDLGLRDTHEFRVQSPEAQALQALISHDQEAAKAKTVQEEAEAAVERQDIPGFYPTPPELAQRVVELAEIDHTHSVLEPSAGKGDLADAIQQQGPYRLDCIEIHQTLAELCSKRHATACCDFLTEDPSDWIAYDRIVMNPPFEPGILRRHLEAAWRLLAPGGRLVAIVPAGATLPQAENEQGTIAGVRPGMSRATLHDVEGTPFSAQMRSAGVRVRILVADKQQQEKHNDELTQAEEQGASDAEALAWI